MKPAAIAAALAWLAIYLPDAGRGFIKDDFAWLLAAPLAPSPWDAAWTASTGFFRPLVSLSFTANHALFGLAPLGYGLTNVALALACAACVFLLARAWGIDDRGALAAAGIWLFTPHGMDMAVIWISGRSALLLVLFATLACAAAARGRPWLAGLWLAGALLSKDEAVMVPALALLSMSAAGRLRDRRAVVTFVLLSGVLLAGYLIVRAQSGAHTPWTAPAEYRPVLSAGALAANLAQYADRLATFPLIVALVAWAAARARPGGIAPHVLPGLAWAAVAMVPTIALPVRSSLYTLLPLAGAALAAGAVVAALLKASDAPRARLVALALIAAAIAAIPLHRSRHQDWSGAARLSSRITAEVSDTLRDVPSGSTVIVADTARPPNLESTFGTLLPEMLRVTTGKSFQLVATPQPDSAVSLTPVAR